MRYVVDGHVDLTGICQAARWKGKACMVGLQGAGLNAEDAEAFMLWAFGTDAVYQRAVSDEALSAERYARITITASSPAMHSVGPPL